MPAIPAATLIPALITGGTAVASTIVGAKVQSGASKRAASTSDKANSEALALEKENEARRREEFDKTQEENKRQFDLALERERESSWNELSDRRRGEARDVDVYNATERRRAPVRAISLGAMQAMARDAGITLTPVETHQLSAPPPVPDMASLAGYSDLKKNEKVA